MAALQQAFSILNGRSLISRNSKPRLYIKVIEAKNLESKDFNYARNDVIYLVYFLTSNKPID
jgi:hypothetical protein